MLFLVENLIVKQIASRMTIDCLVLLPTFVFGKLFVTTEFITNNMTMLPSVLMHGILPRMTVTKTEHLKKLDLCNQYNIK